MSNFNRETRFSASGPMPTVKPYQKRKDNWLDVLQAYWKIDGEDRDKFWSLFDNEDTIDPNIQNLAPTSEGEAALGIAGYDNNLARALGWGDISNRPSYRDFELEDVHGTGSADQPQQSELQQSESQPWNTDDAVVMKYTNEDNMDEAIEHALKNKKILRL